MSFHSSFRRRTPRPTSISAKHSATRALAVSLASAALLAPAAVASDLRSPDARDSAARVQQRVDNVFTGGLRAPDLLAPDARDAPTPAEATTRPRTLEAPTVVDVTRAQGFDWTSAGIGASGGIALALIALAATARITSRSRPAPH